MREAFLWIHVLTNWVAYARLIFLMDVALNFCSVAVLGLHLDVCSFGVFGWVLLNLLTRGHVKLFCGFIDNWVAYVGSIFPDVALN